MYKNKLRVLSFPTTEERNSIYSRSILFTTTLLPVPAPGRDKSWISSLPCLKLSLPVKAHRVSWSRSPPASVTHLHQHSLPHSLGAGHTHLSQEQLSVSTGKSPEPADQSLTVFVFQSPNLGCLSTDLRSLYFSILQFSKHMFALLLLNLFLFYPWNFWTYPTWRLLPLPRVLPP